MGFQASIASTNAGDEAYSPLWRIQTLTWKDPVQAQFLTSLKDLTEYTKQVVLKAEIAGVVVNCPFVEDNIISSLFIFFKFKIRKSILTI